MMKHTGIIIIFNVFFLLCNNKTIAQKTQNYISTNGKLRIEHGQVVNKSGVPPDIRGVSFSWSLWQGQKYYNPAVVDWLSSDFKVSLIRASMAVEPEGGYLEFPEKQMKLICTVIDEAVKNHIYVLIDWHDHHSNLHIDRSKLFFTAMAQKYHGVPNVIYEIWNEPTEIPWDTVKNYALQIIPIIRKYDRDNLIIVGSPHWDQDVDIAANNPIMGFSNIAYSFHFYASDPNHQQALRAKADKAIKKGLPLMVTEWGVGESNGDGKFDKDEVNNWMQWLNDNHMSWTNWNLTDKQETTGLLMPGASVEGGWAMSQLSPAGSFIRERLRGLNK